MYKLHDVLVCEGPACNHCVQSDGHWVWPGSSSDDWHRGEDTRCCGTVSGGVYQGWHSYSETGQPTLMVKVKVDIAPLRDSSPQKRSGVARVLIGSHNFYLYSHTFKLQSEWAIPVFALLDGTHLLTPEGWKAELTWVAGCVVRQFTCLKAVTHPRTSWAQCSATALIDTNTLPLH